VGSVESQGHPSDAANFSVDVEATADAALVVARGELDLHTAPRFSEALAEAEALGAKRLTVDLAGVTFIDSTGLRVLVSCRRRMHAAEGDVVLRAPSLQMKKLLEITGLDDFLSTVD
jgi:anti-anti-sigma factor